MIEAVFKKKIVLVATVLAGLLVCNGVQKNESSLSVSPHIKAITSVEEFNAVFLSSGSRLLVFYLYADWCGPCRMVTPIIENVADAMNERADFFSIDIDKSPQITGIFNTNSIPHVALVSNQTVVSSLGGVHAEQEYIDAVQTFSDPQSRSEPDGQIIDGIRVITIDDDSAPLRLNVYRGEALRLIFGESEYDRTVSISGMGQFGSAKKGEELAISFTVRDVGVVPFEVTRVVNGESVTVQGGIVVSGFVAPEGNQFVNLFASEARELIADSAVVVFDVRTDHEYLGGHLENAVHIPLDQLEQRIGELSEYRDKPFLVYCRSGNRSVVASQILMRNGFHRLYHLRTGIRGWIAQGYELVQ